jgi:Mn2+/Fe2+ NRAMP family transporter
MSANKKIMHGQKNHPLITAFGWLTTVLMVASGIAAVASLFF